MEKGAKSAKGAKAVSVGKVEQADLSQTPVVKETVKIVEQPVEKEMTLKEAEAILEAIPTVEPVKEAEPVKEKKEKKPKEVTVKVVPTAGVLTSVRAYVDNYPDMSIKKSKDGPNQFFVSYKEIKVLYISPNFISIRPEDADKIGLAYEKKGYHHPFKAKLGILEGSNAITLLDMLKTMYPRVEKPKPVKEKVEKKAKEEKVPAEVKVS
ncbi:hypothetical protein [Bacteroides sp.]|uniref:hypothetical protein n=1 Tax=Bacteroides sp. TaxID=29523 RepID=UPI002612A56B|nr:hypothetical protein [Bacteroides sp.]MDD3039776.1 hypothetical protein [Bacteroides sp.]